MSVIRGFFSTLVKVEGAVLCACLSSGAIVRKETKIRLLSNFANRRNF